MATKISIEDLSSAAQTSLDRKLSNGIGRSGTSADQASWDALRSRACKLFLTDPDALVYLYVLASNALASLISQYHGLVCECIVLAESSSSRVSPDPDTESDLSEKKDLLRETISALRENRSGVAGRSLLTSSASYANSVAKASSRKKKMERGKGSLRSLVALSKEASRIGNEILLRISYLTQASDNVHVSLQGSARETILPHMAAILRQTELSPAEEALAIATSAAAYEMLGTKRSTTCLVHTGRSHPIPLTVEVSGTTVRFLDSAKSSVNPSLYMMSPGCVFSTGARSTTISEVREDSIILSEDINATSAAVVRTDAQQQLYDFIVGSLLKMPIGRIRSVSNAVQFSAVRDVSRPESYKMVKSLVELAVLFAPLNTEAARSAAVLGVEVPEDQGYLTTISLFNPSIAKGSVSAVDSVLDKMRGAGADIAISRLLRSEVEVLGVEAIEEVRSATKTAFEISQLMDAITPSTSLG